MARPRRSTAEAFYDVFADFSLEDQAAALRILEQVHRLAVREQAKRPAKLVAYGDAILVPAGSTKLFADDREINALSDLENLDAGDPARNAALLLADDDDKGPKQ